MMPATSRTTCRSIHRRPLRAWQDRGSIPFHHSVRETFFVQQDLQPCGASEDQARKGSRWNFSPVSATSRKSLSLFCQSVLGACSTFNTATLPTCRGFSLGESLLGQG